LKRIGAGNVEGVAVPVDVVLERVFVELDGVPGLRLVARRRVAGSEGGIGVAVEKRLLAVSRKRVELKPETEMVRTNENGKKQKETK